MTSNDNKTDEKERVAKYLARAGVASRRMVEAMIEEGRVSLNGVVLTTPAVKVDERDVISVDGVIVGKPQPPSLWLFHKPRGCLTTEYDPEGRPTIFDYFPDDLPRIVTVGRLDYNSEGLLLLTNDGRLARYLELPQSGLKRAYRVRIFGDVDQDVLDTLRTGVTISGVDYAPITAELERVQGGNAWVSVILQEGKNREIRRIMEYLGYEVNRLIRVGYGAFKLGDLPRGKIIPAKKHLLDEVLKLY